MPKAKLKTQNPDTPIRMLVDDVGFPHDFQNWRERFNHKIHDIRKQDNHYILVCSKARQATPEANEPIRGPDNDSNRDNHMASQSLKSTPLVNTMGEAIGQLFDISA